jgi:outer membrane cobalamin receptor
MKTPTGILLVGIIFVTALTGPQPEDVSFANPVHAEETGQQDRPRFELGEIVVTAEKDEEPIGRIPRNVTVITADDIAQAPSNNLTDLLARESGVHLRSLFGHDKRAGVDIRGMGDTFVSNVIVMVDGFRMNSPDLAGANLAAIALDQIERIEIVRGAGSVLYGDGAVGGVVNIITKKGVKTPTFHLSATYGSYDTSDTRASLGAGWKDVTLSADADYFSTEGYRDNGYLRKKDTSLRLSHAVTPRLTFSGGIAYHNDRYGLPGPVGKEAERSREERVRTSSPNDYGETTERRYTGTLGLDLASLGAITIRGGYKSRDNPFLEGYTPLIPKEEQIDAIDEQTTNLEIGYALRYRLAGLEHGLRCGVEGYRTDYLREDRLTSRKESEVHKHDWFVANDWALGPKTKLSAGYRNSRYEGDFQSEQYQAFFNPNPPFNYLFSSWVSTGSEKEIWKNEAFDIGLTYGLSRDTDLFSSYAKSFRVPNVDELALADTELRPQKGYHVDVGARQRIGRFVEWAVTLFQIRIEDEIYYGEEPITGTSVNRNYDETTRRRGMEADLRVYPLEALYVWGNYAYVDASFEGTEAFVPLVPKHKATIGLEWRVMDALGFSVTGTYVGSRYDGNDQTNDRYAKLPAYRVVDAKLTYAGRALKFFGGVNNLFDERYSNTAYSESYYPMPTRNFFGGVEWRF